MINPKRTDHQRQDLTQNVESLWKALIIRKYHLVFISTRFGSLHRALLTYVFNTFYSITADAHGLEQRLEAETCSGFGYL